MRNFQSCIFSWDDYDIYLPSFVPGSNCKKPGWIGKETHPTTLAEYDAYGFCVYPSLCSWARLSMGVVWGLGRSPHG